MLDGIRIAKLQQTTELESRLKTSLFDKVSSRYRDSSLAAKENQGVAETASVEKHTSYGRVPEYLLRMRERKERDLKEQEEAVRQASIPAGCREMTEQERIETVDDAQKKRRVILEQLKRLPLRIETLGQRKHKIQLEHDLTEIERTLDKLSQRTVLIKL